MIGVFQLTYACSYAVEKVTMTDLYGSVNDEIYTCNECTNIIRVPVRSAHDTKFNHSIYI